MVAQSSHCGSHLALAKREVHFALLLDTVWLTQRRPPQCLVCDQGQTQSGSAGCKVEPKGRPNDGSSLSIWLIISAATKWQLFFFFFFSSFFSLLLPPFSTNFRPRLCSNGTGMAQQWRTNGALTRVCNARPLQPSCSCWAADCLAGRQANKRQETRDNR